MSSTALPSIGIIGFGNMGEALCAGLVKKTAASKENVPISVFDLQADQKLKTLKKYKINSVKTLKELFDQAQIIVIAVKPQDVTPLIDQLAQFGFSTQGKKLVTVAAGMKTSFFTDKLQTPNVVRFMPNLAAKVGASLVGVSPALKAEQTFIDQAILIAQAMGDAALIPEKLMSAVTGLSGSGIAYVFRFIHALAMGGVREGIPYQQALAFALATVEGTVKLLKSTGEHPMAFESKVCSPSGTTVEGVRILEAQGFTATVMDAVSSASRRASEFEV